MVGILDTIAQYVPLPGILNTTADSASLPGEAGVNVQVPPDPPDPYGDRKRQAEAAARTAAGAFGTGASPVPAAGISGQQALSIGPFGALAPLPPNSAIVPDIAPAASAGVPTALAAAAAPVPLPRPRPVDAPAANPGTVDDVTLPANATPTMGQGQPGAPIPETSLLGRIGQALQGADAAISPHTATLLALAGGLAGAPSWGTGLSRGFTAAAAALPEDQRLAMQKGGIQQTFTALREAGVPPQLALASVYNPEVLKTTLQNYVADRQWKTIPINDGFGGQRLVSYNPFTQETKELTPGANGTATSGSGAAAPGIQQVMDSIAQKAASGASRQELLQEVPTAYRSMVDGVLSGNALPANMGRAQVRAPVMAMAHAVDPTFDETMIPTRVKLRQDFAGEGKNGQAIGSFNTVQHHIGKLSDDLEGLSQFNGDYPALNSVRGWLANNANTNPKMRDSLQAVSDDVKAVTDEMSNAYKAGHVSDTEIAQWNKLANSNLPPQQMRRAIADFVDLLNGKRDSLNSMYRQTFHEDAPTIEKQTNAEITQKVHDRLVNGGQAPAASQAAQPINGGLPRMSSPAEAWKLPRGTRFLDSDGVPRVVP